MPATSSEKTTRAPNWAARLSGLLGMLWVSFATRAAFAGNVDSFYLSGDAALQGGAITADVRGGGAAWYNPAGLAKLPRLRLDVSMNAFALRMGGHPNIDATTPNAQVTTLTTPDITLVPASLTLTQRLGKVGVAVGVFVPVQSSTYLRTQVTYGAGEPGPGASFGVDANGHDQSYAVGGAFGVQLAPNLDFGASLFFNYKTEVGTSAAQFSTLDSSGVRASSLQHTTVDGQQLGAQPILGLQFRPAAQYHAGLTLRFPSVQFWQHSQTVAITSVATTGPNGDVRQTSSFDDSTGISASLVAPMRLHLGVSRDFGSTLIALEGSYQAPLYVAQSGVDWKPTINARLGGKHRLSETLAIGGGIHTDSSPVRRTRDFGDAKLDFYGATFALDFGTRYTVSARESEPLPEGSALRFGSTVALSYALGIGEVTQARFGARTNGADLSQVQQRVLVHELILYLASSLTE